MWGFRVEVVDLVGLVDIFGGEGGEGVMYKWIVRVWVWVWAREISELSVY